MHMTGVGHIQWWAATTVKPGTRVRGAASQPAKHPTTVAMPPTPSARAALTQGVSRRRFSAAGSLAARPRRAGDDWALSGLHLTLPCLCSSSRAVSRRQATCAAVSCS